MSEPEEKHVRLRGKQLVCGSLNGMRVRQSLLLPYIAWNQTVLATAVQTLDRDVGPLEGTEAGSCSVGIVEQFQGKSCC